MSEKQAFLDHLRGTLSEIEADGLMSASASSPQRKVPGSQLARVLPNERAW